MVDPKLTDALSHWRNVAGIASRKAIYPLRYAGSRTFISKSFKPICEVVGFANREHA
jgi:hypothetical protein